MSLDLKSCSLLLPWSEVKENFMICSIVLGAYRASDFLKLYHAIFIYIILKNKIQGKKKRKRLE